MRDESKGERVGHETDRRTGIHAERRKEAIMMEGEEKG